MKYSQLHFRPKPPGSTPSIAVAAPGPSLLLGAPRTMPIVAINRAYEYLERVQIPIWAIATGDTKFVQYYLGKKKPPYHNFAYIAHFEPLPFSTHNSGVFGIHVASLCQPKRIYLIGFGGQGHYYDSEGSGFQAELVGSMIARLNRKGIEVILT